MSGTTLKNLILLTNDVFWTESTNDFNTTEFNLNR